MIDKTIKEVMRYTLIFSLLCDRLTYNNSRAIIKPRHRPSRISARMFSQNWKVTKFVFARTAPRREDMPATYSNQHVILFNFFLLNCFVLLTGHVPPHRRMYKYSLLEPNLSSEPCSHSFHRVAPLPLSAHLRVCHMLPVSSLRSAPGRGGLECLAGLHNACSRLAPAFHAE